MIILGLDISTTTIGYSVLNDMDDRIGFLDIRKEATLFDKLDRFAAFFDLLDNEEKIDVVGIESPLQGFVHGRTNAKTKLVLCQFNILCQYVLYKKGTKIELLNVTSARNSVCKHMNWPKIVGKEQKKQIAERFINANVMPLPTDGKQKFDCIDGFVVGKALQIKLLYGDTL